MKTIKINRNDIETVLKRLEVDSFFTSGSSMIVKMRQGCSHGLNVGDFVNFKKYKTMNNDYTDDTGLERVVTDVLDNETFVIQPFRQETYVVKNINAILGTEYYQVVLSENPYIQGVDIDEYLDFNQSGTVMRIYDSTSPDSYNYEFNDVISVYGNVNYTLDEKDIHPRGEVEDGTFFIKGDNAELIYEGMVVEFPFNAFVYQADGGYSFLWNNAVLYHDSSFFNVSVPVFADSEWRNMYQDVLVNEKYVGEMIASLATDPIDMEKIKYVPIYFDEDDKIHLITGITYNFHFRKRVMATKVEYDMTLREMAKKLFYDEGWHMDNDLNGWNEIDTPYDDPEKTELSDSLAYLDFTDNDVETQKKKISKSFLRTIYYNEKDPIEQLLLYYSTTFLDSGVLFGRYVKKKRAALEAGEQWDKETDPKHVIMKTGETEEDRISSQITIHDEYDLTQSSEGFNIYLFAEDAPEINSAKTIYMKAEFNHAGYGRTIPFVRLPKNTKVTIENYLADILYIPVKIGHYVGEGYDIYGYSIEPDGYGVIIRDDNLIFNLFEPKIELSNGEDEIEEQD